jgi:hypothetical protein
LHWKVVLAQVLCSTVDPEGSSGNSWVADQESIDGFLVFDHLKPGGLRQAAKLKPLNTAP